jgi:plastocyanin
MEWMPGDGRKIASIAGGVLVVLTAGLLVAYIPGARPTLNGDMREIVLTPPTSETEKEYRAAVAQAAVESNKLVIGLNCAMSPLVLKLRRGATLTVINDDSINHTIAFENQNFFSVSAWKSRDIAITEIFPLDVGIYRYRCSDQATTTNVGVMYII